MLLQVFSFCWLVLQFREMNNFIRLMYTERIFLFIYLFYFIFFYIFSMYVVSFSD